MPLEEKKGNGPCPGGWQQQEKKSATNSPWPMAHDFQKNFQNIIFTITTVLSAWFWYQKKELALS